MNKKSRILRRVLSVFLAAVMTAGVGFAALPAIAGDGFGIVANAASAEGFEYKLYNGGAQITGLTSGSGEELVIPSTLGGYPVTRIYNGAFSGNSTIKKVTIPSTVNWISDSAFYGCSSLEEVNILSEGFDVGKYAFYECTSLRSINLKNATYLGQEAFRKCSSLNNIVYPDSLSKLPSGLFMDCTGLTAVSLPENITEFDFRVFANCTSLRSINIPAMKNFGSWVFEGCENVETVTLGDGVEYVPFEFLKDDKKLKSVTLGKNIGDIGEYAFYCTGLESITIPDSVQSIGSYSFAGCENLTSVTLPEGLTNIAGSAFDETPITADTSKPVYFGDMLYQYRGTDSTLNVKAGTKYICNEAVRYNESLKHVSFPTGLVGIGENAFAGCSALEKVALPEGIVSVGENAFAYCSALTSVTAPDSLTYISAHSFYKTPWFDNSTADIYLGRVFLCQRENKARVLMPAGIISIADYAFENDDALKSIRISNSLKVVGNSAFEGCENLADIELKPNITEIGARAFAYTGIKSITLPDKVAKIGGYAFQTVEEIDLSPKMTKIPDHAFEGSMSLKKAVIPEGVTSIGAYAFSNCPEIEEVSLPESLKQVGECAFCDFSRFAQIINYGEAISENSDQVRASYALKSVTIPAGVKTIGEQAFGYCQYGTLTDFRIYGTKGTAAQKYARENGFAFNDEYVETISAPADVKDYYIGKPALVFSVSQYYGDDYKVYFKRDTAKNWVLSGTGDGTVVSLKNSGAFMIKIEYTLSSKESEEIFYTGVAEKEQITNTSSLSQTSVSPGTRVTVNGSAESGTGLYGYQYRYKKSTAKTWASPMEEMIKDSSLSINGEIFAEQSSFSFKPKSAGVYDIEVRVGDVITGSVEVKALQLYVYSDKEFANLSTVDAASVTLGTRVNLSGSAEGGTETYTYSYYYKKSGAKVWNAIGAENTTSGAASFKPKAAGSYDLKIVATDGDGKSIEKTFALEVK